VPASLPSTLFQNQALNTKIAVPKSLQQNYWPSAVLFEKPVYLQTAQNFAQNRNTTSLTRLLEKDLFQLEASTWQDTGDKKLPSQLNTKRQDRQDRIDQAMQRADSLSRQIKRSRSELLQN
jgi:hypothetical protein